MKLLNKPLETKPGCVATAATILGNKWTAQILNELARCPGRFCSLEKTVTGINPRILSQRLDQLEASGIIEKSASGYGLTKKGQDLIPVLKQMAAWGAKYCKKVK
jgi:DNA-binding HxlR family transcriptional regulator